MAHDMEGGFSPSPNTRAWLGHPMKWIGWRFRAHKRRCFFIRRIICLCNSAPQDLMLATGLDGLKGGLDTFTEDGSIQRY